MPNPRLVLITRKELASDVGETDKATGLIPEITSAVPAIWAAGTAFVAGWEIGEGPNALFTEIGPGEGSAPSEPERDFCYSETCRGKPIHRSHGSEIFFGAKVQQSPGACLCEAEWNSEYFDPARWWEPPCAFTGFTVPPEAYLESNVPS